MFEGLEGIALADGSREEYRHGALSFDQEYVDALAAAYAENATASRASHGRIPSMEPKGELASLLRWLPDYITRFIGFGGQAFLTGVAGALLRAMPLADEDECFHAYLVLSPVMRELCKAGHRSLTLDLSAWPHAPFHLLDGIKATAEKPVFVDFVLPERSLPPVYVGEGSEHCVATISGDVTQLGIESSHCDFTLEEMPREAFGRGSSASAYRFATATGLDLSRYRRAVPGGNTSDGEFYGVEGYVDDGYLAAAEFSGSPRAIFHLPDEFFWEGNTLYIPDGAGSWQEVTR